MLIHCGALPQDIDLFSHCCMSGVVPCCALFWKQRFLLMNQLQYDFVPSLAKAIQSEHGESHLPWRYGRHLVQEPSQFPLSVTSFPHSCLFLSWPEEFFHPDTDLWLGPLSFGMAANRNLQNFLCLRLLIFCYLEECGCEINFLLTTGFGHPAFRPVRVNPVGLMLLSVLFARYICILAVLFI